MAVGDLNGDGLADLAVVNSASNNVSVLLNRGSSFPVSNRDIQPLALIFFQSEMEFGVGTNPGSIAIGDFNGDGKLDIVIGNRNSSNLSVLINNTP